MQVDVMSSEFIDTKLCVYVWKHISTQVCFLAIPSTDSVPMLLLGWTLNLLKGWVYFPCFEGRIYRFQLSHIHKSWPLLSAARSEPLEREKRPNVKLYVQALECVSVHASCRNLYKCTYFCRQQQWLVTQTLKRNKNQHGMKLFYTSHLLISLLKNTFT